jgi:hypothetical protein
MKKQDENTQEGKFSNLLLGIQTINTNRMLQWMKGREGGKKKGRKEERTERNIV